MCHCAPNGQQTGVKRPGSVTRPNRLGMDLAGCCGIILWARHHVCRNNVWFQHSHNDERSVWTSLTYGDCVSCQMPTDHVNCLVLVFKAAKRSRKMQRSSIGPLLAGGQRWLLDLAMEYGRPLVWRVNGLESRIGRRSKSTAEDYPCMFGPSMRDGANGSISGLGNILLCTVCAVSDIQINARFTWLRVDYVPSELVFDAARLSCGSFFFVVFYFGLIAFMFSCGVCRASSSVRELAAGSTSTCRLPYRSRQISTRRHACCWWQYSFISGTIWALLGLSVLFLACYKVTLGVLYCCRQMADGPVLLSSCH